MMRFGVYTSRMTTHEISTVAGPEDQSYTAKLCWWMFPVAADCVGGNNCSPERCVRKEANGLAEETAGVPTSVDEAHIAANGFAVQCKAAPELPCKTTAFCYDWPGYCQKQGNPF
jgi:hypothetical protein